ncbi:MAG: polysaccharide deacetylase family protein [bacterium]
MKVTIKNSLIRFLGQFTSPPDIDEPVYRFVTYHRISPDQATSFRKQVDRIQNNFNVVSPRQYKNSEGSTETLNVLFTFDDGYLSWENTVLPVLNERDIKGLFFVCPDFVGLNEDEARNYSEQFLNMSPSNPLTEEGIKTIIKSDHTVGNHLLEHRDLRDTPPGDQIRNIMEQSQTSFEEHFEITPEWLAYPFADYFTHPERLTRVTGEYFDYAVTLIPGWNTPSTNPLFLTRVNSGG